MPEQKYLRDLNMIINDPDPQKSHVVLGKRGGDPLKLYVGDNTPEGDVLEEIGDRSATFLPPYQKDATEQTPAYTRTMGDNPPLTSSPPKPGSSRQEMADWSKKFFTNQVTSDLAQSAMDQQYSRLNEDLLMSEPDVMTESEEKRAYFDREIATALENGDQDWADFLALERQKDMLPFDEEAREVAREVSERTRDFMDGL